MVTQPFKRPLHGCFLVVAYKYMEKKYTANTRISDKLNQKLEEIIEEGGIHSRSEAVRFSIHATHLLMISGEDASYEEIRDIIDQYLNVE